MEPQTDQDAHVTPAERAKGDASTLSKVKERCERDRPRMEEIDDSPGAHSPPPRPRGKTVVTRR